MHVYYYIHACTCDMHVHVHVHMCRPVTMAISYNLIVISQEGSRGESFVVLKFNSHLIQKLRSLTER